MSKFHVKVGKLKPGELRGKFSNRKAFDNFKFAAGPFVKGGTTEENFKRRFNVDYCAGTQKEL